AGTTALGNGGDGVVIQGHGDHIGGTAAAERNLISGNGKDGVWIQSFSTGDLIEGNTIGTDVTGAVALGNSLDGVFVDGAPNNTIGGTTSGAGNLISGNQGNGLNL